MSQSQNKLEKFGLRLVDIDKINSVFKKYPSIEKVLIFGSRAKGNYKLGSDIDLSVVGSKLSAADFSKLHWDLDDLNLPYKMDVSLYHQLDSEDFIEHINRVGQIFYTNI